MSLWIMYNNENFTMLRLKSFNKYLYIYSFNFLVHYILQVAPLEWKCNMNGADVTLFPYSLLFH